MSTPKIVPTPVDRAEAEKTNPERVVGDKTTIRQFGASAPTDEVRPIPTIPGYAIETLLGEGGMGAVYAAVDLNLRRKVAIKVMLPATAASPSARDRFLREARSAAAVDHENVVAIYHVAESDGQPYLVMPLLKGRSLSRMLQESGRPGVADVVRIAREVAAGLAAAHACGLVHRDVKPSNIWIDEPTGRVRLLDFGLAKPHESVDGHLSKSGEVLGSPAYMSPEQAAGEPVDPRTDLFSLGAVLYEMLTGTMPFSGPTVIAVLTALATKDPTPVRGLNPNVPSTLDRLVRSLLAKEPMHRPRSAADVEQVLGQIQLGSRPTSEAAAREVIEKPVYRADLPTKRTPAAPPEPEPSVAPPWARSGAGDSEPLPAWLARSGKPHQSRSTAVDHAQSHRALASNDMSTPWRQPTVAPRSSSGSVSTYIAVGVAAVLVVAFFVVLLVTQR
jgi:serine/threonine protein kinase